MHHARIGHAAHPRSRGENPVGAHIVDQSAGSSPLTRGKPTTARIGVSGFRLIPAHAGKTHDSRLSPQGDSAHPRSRGENELSVRRCATGEGSSPLTRGKLWMASAVQCVGRLIPAHAGKTWSASVHTLTRSAHPRSRGENWPCVAWRPLRAGSSPLTRGKLNSRS